MAAFLGMTALLALMNGVYHGFFSGSEIVLAAGYAAVLIVCVLERWLPVFAVALLVPLALANGLINPVDRGLDVVTQSALFRAVQGDPRMRQGKWLVYSHDFTLTGFVVATGAEVFNSFKVLPNLNAMAAFDPDRRHLRSYNQSGHMLARPLAAGEPCRFENPDVGMLEWSVSPLDPGLRKVGVRFLVFDEAPEAATVGRPAAHRPQRAGHLDLRTALIPASSPGLPHGTTDAAAPTDPPRTAGGWRGSMALALFLGVSLGLLAWFFAWEVVSLHAGNPHADRDGTDHATALLVRGRREPGTRGCWRASVNVSPRDGLEARPFFPGQAATSPASSSTRCSGKGRWTWARRWCGAMPAPCSASMCPFHEFKLTDYVLLHQIVSADQQGDHLHMITTPKADTSICGITLEEAVRLGFNAEAFVLTFVPVAFGWTFLVLLAAILVTRPGRPWRARLRGWWPGLLAALLETRPTARGPDSRWERRAVTAIFVLSAAVQTNAVLHGGSKGQDYPLLYRFSENIASAPGRAMAIRTHGPARCSCWPTHFSSGWRTA